MEKNDWKIALVSKKSLSLRDILGFATSVFFLWLTFRNSGLLLGDIKMKGTQACFFVGAVFILIVSFWLYSIRAKLIWINKKNKKHSVDTLDSLILGNFYNSILPGNLGEGVRAWHFSKKNNVSFSSSLSAIITEKWLDAQLFSLLVMLLFFIKPFTYHYISLVLVCMAVTVLIASIIHFIMRYNCRIEKSIGHIALYFGKAGRFLFKIYLLTNRHLDNLKSNKSISSYVVLFMFIFLLNMWQFFLLQKAAGVPDPVHGVYSSFLISLSMMIIAFIPSAPGSIGVLHYGIYSTLVFAASQYGVEPDVVSRQSFALFAVYAHLSFFFPEVFLGILYLVKEKGVLFSKNAPS